MRRTLRFTALAVTLTTTSLTAQQPDTLPNDRDVLVLDHDFTGGGEFARAVLLKYEVYRAELSTNAAAIEVYPLKGGQPVFIMREETGYASGSGLYTLYPTETKEYQFRLVSGGPVVRLKVYRDIKRSQRRNKMMTEPGWEIGGEIALGGHTGYLLNTTPGNVADSQKDGLDIEGCFSARSGPGALQYVSGCAFGLGWDQRSGSRGTAWVFIEPRVRLFGGKARGISNDEIGLLGRVSMGFISGINRNPKMVAIGAYATRNVRWNSSGKGLSFTLAYRQGWVSGLGMVGGGMVGEPFGKQTTHRFNFAIGYYQ